MADVKLTAQRRSASGKGAAGRIRREGLVPGVVYGLDTESTPVSVKARELGVILASERGVNTLITLEIDGAPQLALARQIQRNPIKGTLVHVDFVRVRADQTIQAEVPVRLTGDAEGVARGGVLEQLLHSVTVDARPADIPDSLDIDISSLEIGGSVRVSELVVPAGVALRNEPEAVVATISAPRVGEEAAGVEGAEGEAGAPAAEGGAPATEAAPES
jgi:large subunit ribosomal protein L25